MLKEYPFIGMEYITGYTGVVLEISLSGFQNNCNYQGRIRYVFVRRETYISVSCQAQSKASEDTVIPKAS